MFRDQEEGTDEPAIWTVSAMISAQMPQECVQDALVGSGDRPLVLAFLLMSGQRPDLDPLVVSIEAKLRRAGEALRHRECDPVVVSIEAKLRRGGKGKRFVIENGAEVEVNAGLAAMIAEAFAIRN